MKKKYLKEWIEKLLLLVLAVSVLFLAGETQNIVMFIVTKAIAITVIIIDYSILNNHGKIFNELTKGE